MHIQWLDNLTALAKRNVLLPSDTTFVAVTEIDKHTISTSVENGFVVGDGTYNYGSVITLTNTPNEHYHFVKWSWNICQR